MPQNKSKTMKHDGLSLLTAAAYAMKMKPEENILCSLCCLLFNSSSSMKTLHTVTAVIELGAGLALLWCPSATGWRSSSAACRWRRPPL